MFLKLASCCLACLVAAAASAQSVMVPRATLESYVGAYQTASGHITRVMLKRDQLVSEDSLGGMTWLTQLIAQSETSFVAGTDGVRVEFVKDGTGRVTHLLRTGSSAKDKAVRVVVTPEVLAEYVGSYALEAEFSIAITVEGDQLMAQGPSQSKHPLFPESVNRFFVQDYNSDDVAQLEFGIDQKGSAFVIIRQGGGE